MLSVVGLSFRWRARERGDFVVQPGAPPDPECWAKLGEPAHFLQTSKANWLVLHSDISTLQCDSLTTKGPVPSLQQPLYPRRCPAI